MHITPLTPVIYNNGLSNTKCQISIPAYRANNYVITSDNTCICMLMCLSADNAIILQFK